MHERVNPFTISSSSLLAPCFGSMFTTFFQYLVMAKSVLHTHTHTTKRRCTDHYRTCMHTGRGKGRTHICIHTLKLRPFTCRWPSGIQRPPFTSAALRMSSLFGFFSQLDHLVHPSRVCLSVCQCVCPSHQSPLFLIGGPSACLPVQTVCPSVCQMPVHASLSSSSRSVCVSSYQRDVV